MSTIGILRGNNDDPYSCIGMALTKSPFSVVGIFCTVNATMQIVLFRTFDGTVSFQSFSSLVELAECGSITELEVSYFAEDDVNLFYNTNLPHRMANAIHKTLLENNPIPDYRNLLFSLVGLEESCVKNGYLLVNEILHYTFQTPLLEDKTLKIGLNRFASPWTSLMGSVIKNTKKAHIHHEVQSSMETLFRTFQTCIEEDKFFAEALRTREWITFVQPSSLSGEIFSIEKEVRGLKNILQPLISPSSEAIVIPVDILFRIYNRLAQKMGQEEIIIPVKSFQSIGTVVLDFRSTEDVMLKVDDRFISIGTTETVFSSFSERELVQILRYLQSIHTDSRYHNVADRIVKELAERVKIVHL